MNDITLCNELVLSGGDRRLLARRILDQLAHHLASERSALFVRDDENRQLVLDGLRVVTGMRYDSVVLGYDLIEAQRIVAQTEPTVCPAIYQADLPLPAPPDLPRNKIATRVLVFPVRNAQASPLAYVLFDIGAATTVPSATLSRMEDLGNLIAVGLKNAMDIEQLLRDSRARYRAMVDESPDMIVRLTSAGELIFVNDTYCQCVGLAREAAIGRAFDLPVLAEDRAIFDEMRHTLTPDMSPKAYDLRLDLPDGTIRWHHWSVSPVMDDQHHFIEYQVVGRDTTLQRFAEEERRQLQDQMLESQRMESMGVMAGGIAHDFNNLLATVLGNTELALESDTLPVEIRDYMNESRKAILKASNLSREMLLYAGEHPLRLQPLTVNEAILEIQHLFETNISRNATIHYSLGTESPSISADRAQLHQLLVNLVTNASEALNDEAGDIRISTGLATLRNHDFRHLVADKSLPEGRYGFISVADTGCGIPAEKLRHIFEPFYSTKFIGRGLGLAAVHGIMRAHKGAIDVRSNIGNGSTFTLYFPAADARAKGERPSDDQGTIAERKPGHILLADDEAGVRQIVEYVLHKSGYTVQCAVDGQEAVDLFQSDPAAYSAVLLDMKMPRMSGDKVYRVMRELKPDIPIVILSGYSEQHVLQSLVDDHPAGFIQKPFEVKTLLNTVQRIC